MSGEPERLKQMRAGIFDLDGVIVDTARYHFLAWKRIAHELGVDFTEAQNERLKGVSRMRSLEILLEEGKLTLPESQRTLLAERKNAWYVEQIQQMEASAVLRGAREYLQLIRRRGVRTALVSASKNATLILDRVQIGQLFDVMVDGNRVTRSKPDPEGFLLAASELKLSPAECVVFEDAQAGIAAARSAGMFAVGIGRADILTDADVVVPALEALIDC